VLTAVVNQKTDWPFDIMVVDSGSTDNTIEIINEFSDRGVRLHKIPNSDFQHGRTRNLAISLTSAEFIAVITQDATPATSFWLSNLVKSFDKGDQVAAVFGGHYAYPNANEFIRNGIDLHFQHFDRLPHLAQWQITPPEMEWGSLQHQQWLHYYSDNNSAMRRCVWEKIPYPEIAWGEDQVWAWEIIKQGYQKVYANDAFVFHSHDLSLMDQEKLSTIEGEFWLKYFNYRFEKSPIEVQTSIEYLNHRATQLAAARGVESTILEHQLNLNAVSVRSRYLSQENINDEWHKKCISRIQPDNE
jgi:glycosyltransferase involved in cell wall biosynthesis